MASSPNIASHAAISLNLTSAQRLLIIVLAAIQFTHMVDFVIVMPLGARIMSEFKISTEQFSYIVATYTISAAIAGLLAATIVNRFDRKTVVLSMYGGFIVSTLACGLADSYLTMLISRSLAGAFGGLSAMAIMTVIGDVFPPRQRGVASGAVMSSFAVASIVGLPIGLYLAARFDSRGMPFIVLAGFSLLVWLVGLRYLPSLTDHQLAAADRPSSATEFKNVVKDPVHLRAFAFTFMVVLGTFTVVPFLGPYLIRNLGKTEENLSIIYMVAGIMTLAGMTILGKLSDRFPKVTLFRIMAFGAISMTLILTNLPDLPVAALALIAGLFMTFAGGRMVPAQTLLIGIPSLRNRGPFMSLNTAVQHTASGLAAILGGIIAGSAENQPIANFWIIGIVAASSGIISIIIAGWLMPNRKATPAVSSEQIPQQQTVPEIEALAAV